MKFSLLVLCLTVLSSNTFVTCAKLPPGAKRCKITDSVCLKDSAQKFLPLLANGIPELGIQPFEPLDIGLVTNNGILNFNFSNTLITGLTKLTKINDLSFDTKKKRIHFSFVTTSVMEGDYQASGRLLILPVVGNGQSYFKTYELLYVFKMAYETNKGQDGKEYIKITRHKLSFTPTDVDFRFTNLFNGNKQLSDALHQFGKEHWRELFGELGKPFITKIASKVIETFNNIFSRVPKEEVFLV